MAAFSERRDVGDPVLSCDWMGLPMPSADEKSSGTRKKESYLVRLSVASHTPALLREHGIEPDPFFERHGFNPALFASPDHPVVYHVIAQFIDACAHETACDTFGLKLGLRGRLATLGPLADEMLKAPTVGGALLAATRKFRTHDQATIIVLQDFGDEVELQHMIVDPRVSRGGQMTDLSVGFMFAVIRELCGHRWSSTCVSFVRRMPADAMRYRTSFACPLVFDSPMGAVRFSKHWLAAPVAHPKDVRPDRFGGLAEGSLKEQVLGLCIRLTLSSGECSVERVAAELGMIRRTLHRRLAAEDTTFEQLLKQARLSAAIRLMWDTDLKLTDIAMAVGYSELSSFTRAFHVFTGMTPSKFTASLRLDAAE